MNHKPTVIGMLLMQFFSLCLLIKISAYSEPKEEFRQRLSMLSVELEANRVDMIKAVDKLADSEIALSKSIDTIMNYDPELSWKAGINSEIELLRKDVEKKK